MLNILHRRFRRVRPDKTLDFLIRLALVLILFLAPLAFASVEVWAYSAIEIGVAAAGLLWLYRLYLYPATRIVWSRLYIPPVLFLALTAFQLVPLPPGFLRVVSPNTAALYERTVPGYVSETHVTAETEAALAGEPPPRGAPWMPVSQSPNATLVYLLKGLAFTLFFFLFLNVFEPGRRLRWLLYAFAGAGFFEAFYGLIEFLSGRQHIFAYQKKYYTDVATGTFINRNHYAGFLEMALLVSLGLLFSRLRESHVRRTWKDRLLAFTDRRANLNFILVFSISIILIALVLSFSRAGIVLGLTMTGLFCLSQLPKGRSALKLAIIGVMTAVVLVPILGIGYWKLSDRYSLLSNQFALPGGRVTVWERTLDMAQDFPLLGTGVGTFQYVFPRYRLASIRAFYDYAHNDFLQVLAETGWVGAVLLAYGLYLIARVWLRRSSPGSSWSALRWAMGFALLSIGLHEMVDFGLQMPANFLAVTFLVGTLTLAAKAEDEEKRLGVFGG